MRDGRSIRPLAATAHRRQHAARVVGRSGLFLVATIAAAMTAGLGCNAVLDNDEGILITHPPWDSATSPSPDDGSDGRDASLPDATAEKDGTAADRTFVAEVAVEDQRAPEPTAGDRQSDEPGSDAGLDSTPGDALDGSADTETGMPDRTGSIDAPDDRSLSEDAAVDRAADAVDASSSDAADVSIDRASPPTDVTQGKDASEAGSGAQDADAPNPPDALEAGNDVGPDTPTCVPNTGDICGNCHGLVLCDGTCDNLGDPTFCERGRCGLGCGGYCGCPAGQFCTSLGYCRTPCPSGQTCCDEDCTICITPPQQCP